MPHPAATYEEKDLKIVRVYTGDDNQSHFEVLPVDFVEHGRLGRISAMIPAQGVLFREVDGDYDLDFHNAPRRQFVINLKGSVDIEIGDGTVRRLGPGDILLAEDVTGQGHRSRAVDGEPRECLFIPLRA